MVCTPTCVADEQADLADLKKCVASRNKACKKCKDVKEEQCLLVPKRECTTVEEEQCTGKKGKKCIKSELPDCTPVLERNCTMTPSEECKQIALEIDPDCEEKVITKCKTIEEPDCKQVSVPDCEEKKCEMVEVVDAKCNLKLKGDKECEPVMEEKCEMVEGTKCGGLKKVTKCTSTLVTKCQDIMLPCGDESSIVGCDMKETCKEVNVDDCPEVAEGSCGPDATDCKVVKVKRCDNVKEEVCSEALVEKCKVDLETCDVPECEGPKAVECNGETCAVGEKCSSICDMTTLSDAPEDCEFEEVMGCVS
ncbi:hypothetical protein BSKO_06006 [Bryopsis sp. KO-2023]|nr:hypothetical protein BSKO_06006 [Bryopsis sp. KO-2023]